MGASGAEELIKVRILQEDDKSFHIEASMKDEDRVGMLLFLVQNVDVFAWSPYEVFGVDPEFIVHELNVDPLFPPKKQKPRRSAKEHVEAVRQEVKKLKEGYHQIFLATKDQKKTGFISPDANFHYTVMPFELKNAGATYQQIMKRMFRDKIGHTVKVYIDDMVVKSKWQAQHIDDLKEVFKVLQQHKLHLNADKCAFGVGAGKFLGYMITNRGIEVNSDQIEVIECLKPPSNPRRGETGGAGQVQTCQNGWVRSSQSGLRVKWFTGQNGSFLNGSIRLQVNRVAGQSGQFADRYHPFYQLLKKWKRFQWNEECENAFQDLKEYLTRAPMLMAPEPREDLFMYLSMSKHTVSAVLLRDQGVQQQLYYVNKTLVDAKTRYLPLEKLRSNIKGKIGKWGTRLDSFDIRYKPRNSVKGQVLTDFFAEFSSMREMEVVCHMKVHSWKVFVDNASSAMGVGARIVIITPEGIRLEHSFRLGFRASNNEAKYKALLAGLRAVQDMGA
ncbi:uncharacterized protein LOC111992436 [Quercus suber]|uniref:uncharacterized protein LOC111992436 n=1 Tax=Quercus suber TaxID=58331 RepID=UPI000CE23819|nr:uncharacterized protein LOC111992436 [Quercus suber]